MKASRHRILIRTLIFLVIYFVIILNVKYIYLIDEPTRGFVESFSNELIYDIFTMITKLGSRNFLIIFSIFISLVLLLKTRRFREVAFFLGGVLITFLLNKFTKIFVARSRPLMSEELDALGYSFPSGHAMISFVAYGLAAFFLTRHYDSLGRIQMKFCFYSVIVLIGFSRYILNVHYLTDVLIGFLFGYLFYFWWISFYNDLDDLKMDN